MIKLKNREEKIAFLQGLRDGKRKLEEIVELQEEYITYKDTKSGVLITGRNGNVLTREEAKAIRNRTGQNMSLYVYGIPGGLAYTMWEEDVTTNQKAGVHTSFIPGFGNEPLIDDDSELIY